MSKNKKKLTLVLQAKGGAGKSALIFMLALRYPDAIFLDLDDATKTTIKQLAYKKPKFISLKNDNSAIDRGLINDFLEFISQATPTEFFADCGGSISDQFPDFINDYGAETLAGALNEIGVSMNLILVVAGSNNFSQCMDFAERLLPSVKKQIHTKVALNDFHPLVDDQIEAFENFCKKFQITKEDVFHFTISKDRNQSTQDKIASVLKSGKGIEQGSPLLKLLFSSYKELNVYGTKETQSTEPVAQ